MRGLRESEARMATAADRLIAWWAALAKRWNPILLIVAVWAVLALPLVWMRGFNSDDGVAVTLAQTAIMDGQWLTPHMFNLRFAERPVLLSWVIAALSLPFGSVSEFTARLPIILSLLGGCLLIFDLLRRVASVPAALFGVALFLACPLVLRAYVMTTADLPLAVLLFLAFYVWWTGFAAGRLTLLRWIGIGGVLAFAALLKGPQPVGYFFLGVGAFVVVSRSWTQLPGLVLAGVVSAIPVAAWYMHVYAPGDETTWAMFMRLDRVRSSLPHPARAAANIVVETLPASILVSLFLLTGAARRGGEPRSSFVAALACYAFTCTVALLFWPGGEAARYFFPVAPPLCVLGGLAFDSLSGRRPLLVAPVLIATLGILGYAAVYSAVASPLLAAQFRSSKIDAARIMERVLTAPAPIYRVGPAALNEFSYLPVRVITVVDMRLLETLRGPAWIVMPSDAADDLLAKRPGALHFVMAFGRPERWRLLRLDD